MIRFIAFLLGKSYEPCKGCEILKQQLELANDEKKYLTETLMGIIKPRTYESTPVELNPIAQTSGLFSRRRQALEDKSRQEAKILRDSTVLGKRDDELKNMQPIKPITTIEALEKELEIHQGGEVQ